MLNIPKVVVILGPNSSGKSSLGVSLAVLLGYEKTKEELNINGAEIISADSRQTYKGLDIGSGKITKKEMLGIPHHMIDVASPKKTFSVVQYQKYAKKAVNNILGLGKLPIIVGGTGFYVDSIIYDMSFPAAPPQMKFRKRLEKLNASELFEQLKRLDPERAKDIDKHNKRRLVRALEIIEYTGKPVPQISRTYEYDVLKIGIGFPKSVLKERISKRLNKRLDNGMVEEVKSLHNSGVSWKKMDDLGLEYRYVSHYLRRMISYEEMRKTLFAEIQKFAKRQMTWFKRDKEIIWINPSSIKESPTEKVFPIVKEFLS